MNLPTRITTPATDTFLTYTGDKLTSRTETDLSPWNAGSRTWTYSYTAQGLLQAVDGPLPGNTDTTTYTWNNGRLASVTNALGHVTQITAYNVLGHPATLVDANGITTTLAYNARRWLTSSTRVDPQAGNLVTTYTRDAAGNITRITLPDGSYTDYEYNAAGDVTAIQDASGARIVYTRDAERNVSAIDTYHSSGALVRRLFQTHDGLKQLTAATGMSNTHAVNEYDANANPTRSENGLGLGTDHVYDALDRLVSSTDATGAQTQYGYDADGNLASVTDARNLTTTYEYDGFGCLRRLTSPDTEITLYTCDAAGNVTTKTDARGITATYGYDALNRRTSTVYSGAPTETALFGYDATANGNKGIGQLTAAQNDGADVAFKYDARGNRVQDQRVIGGITYTTAYAYNNADRVSTLTYPSGRTVTYTRNAAGQVTAISTTANGSTQTVANNIVHAPFGDIESLTHGNGLTETRNVDSDGHLTQIKVNGSSLLYQRDFTRDAAGRITAITDSDSSRSETYAYNAADRLTAASGPYGTLGYTYDGVGNRLSEDSNGNSSSYSYAQDANRLYQITGNDAASLDYDAAGNTVLKGSAAFTYNAANRLQSVTLPGANGTDTTTFAYNALGERVVKNGIYGTTHFHYASDGRLLAETDASGNVIREYIWLEQRPVALVAQPNAGGSFALYAVHTDQIDTALALTDSTQTVTWRYDRKPFGQLAAGGNKVRWSLRFPGQYEDWETGIFYNYFRDYDATTGRYIESDPIGLAGGINTYAYALGNPVGNTDFFGLKVCSCQCVSGGGVREGPLNSNGQQQKFCTYKCSCGKNYFSTKFPSGFDDSALCIQQWDPPPGIAGTPPHFGFFSFETDPDTFSGWWDRFNPLNGIPADFIDQVSKHPEAKR